MARLDARDLAAQMAQKINIVNQVDEHRARAGLTPPGLGKIFVRLVEPELRVYERQMPKATGVDGLFRSGDHGIVPTMMPDKERYPGCLGRADKRCPIGRRVCYRLFNKHRHTLGDAGKAVLGVKLVWRGNDCALDIGL